MLNTRFRECDAVSAFVRFALNRGSVAFAVLASAVFVAIAGGDARSTVVAQDDGPPAFYLDTCLTQVRFDDQSLRGLTGDLALDCAWLLSMKSELEGSASFLNWGTSNPIKDWRRITVAGTPPRVTGIQFESVYFMGVMPADLAELKALEVFEFQYSGVSGELPDLSGLTELRRFVLVDTSITGRIPAWVVNLTYQKLEQVLIAFNNLSGPIPYSTRQRRNEQNVLKRFEIFGNSELSGRLPEFLCDASGLTYLSINYLKSPDYTLASTIPACFGGLTELTYLDLTTNGLSGEFPSELLNLTKLSVLNLASNELSGEIPSDLENLDKLVYLSLRDNRFSGAIPTQLGNLTKLTDLSLGDNQLTGAIPAEMGNLTDMQYLYLNENQLTGTIPSELGNLTKMIHMFLNNNRLSGPIPTQFGNFATLLTLNLANNQLSGPIPSQIGNLSEMISLYLQSNQLTSGVPENFKNLSKLKNLRLEDNQMTEKLSADVLAWLKSKPTGRRFGLDLPLIADVGLTTSIGLGSLYPNKDVYLEIPGDSLPQGADVAKSYVVIQTWYRTPDSEEHTEIAARSKVALPPPPTES